MIKPILTAAALSFAAATGASALPVSQTTSLRPLNFSDLIQVGQKDKNKNKNQNQETMTTTTTAITTITTMATIMAADITVTNTLFVHTTGRLLAVWWSVPFGIAPRPGVSVRGKHGQKGG